MTPVIYALPFDPTGQLHRNRVLREYHDLSKQAGLTYRTFVLDHGFFYTEGLEVEDSSGHKLVPDVDFQCVGGNTAATVVTGKEVCSVIVVLNPQMTNEMFVNASMVGGEYCNVISAIADMSAGLLNPTRNPTYRNIEGKPDTFEVGGHMHAMWELYGFEGMVDTIDLITTSKLSISARTYEATRLKFDSRMDVLDVDFDLLLLLLQQHLAASNPHQVTSLQVGLNFVENYPVVSEIEATTRGFNSKQRYLTVQRFKQMLDVNFIADLLAHTTLTNNPHRVTAAQADTLTIREAEAQLLKKLDSIATAVSTFRLESLDWDGLINNVKSNMDAAQIISGTVDPHRLTADNNRFNFVGLVANNQVVNLATEISNLAKRGTEIVYLQAANGQNIAAVLASTYADNVIWNPGTLAFVMVYYGGAWGYGNASESRSAWRLQCWVKVDTVNWQSL